MATLGTSSHASVNNTPRRSYISTAPFQNYFFSYTVSNKGINIIGSLSLIEELTCEKCPVGRILRETGRKLYPDANNGVKRYMVGVYDTHSLINGFIDPNASVFAVYNSDRPTYIPDNVDSSDDETEGSVDNYGAPVLTSGNIISTDGFVGIQSTIATGTTYAGAYVYEDTPIVEAGTNFNSECQEGDASEYTYATMYPNGTIESIHYFGEGDSSYVRLTSDGDVVNTGNTSTLGTISYATGLRVPEPGLVGVTNLSSGAANVTDSTGCTSNSRIFLTNLTLNANTGILRVKNVANGSFSIESTDGADTNAVQYFIVN